MKHHSQLGFLDLIVNILKCTIYKCSNSHRAFFPIYIMKTSVVTAAFFLQTTLGAPLDKKESTFKIPSIGDDITKWTNELVGHVADLIWDHVPMSVVDAVVPHISLDLNAKLVQALALGIPNYNTDFGKIESLDDGRVKWLFEANDRTPDDPVIFYIHGGGYGWGPLPTMSLWPVEAYRQLNNDRLSCVWIDYSLSSEEYWPAPLQQAVQVFNELKKTSNNIIAVGDSAGGHTIVQLARHLKYPYPGVDAIDSLPDSIALLSPGLDWNLSDDEGSGKENKGKDILDAASVVGWGELETKNDTSVFHSPTFKIQNDTIDWSDTSLLPDASKIFVSYGDSEVLKDGTTAWVNMTGIEGRGATVYEKPQGTHDPIVFTGALDPTFNHLVTFLKGVIGN